MNYAIWAMKQSIERRRKSFELMDISQMIGEANRNGDTAKRNLLEQELNSLYKEISKTA